jgi:hypothetical protein
MRECDREDGSILILTAFVLVVLLGVTALALDAGYLFDSRRQLQFAADAGAIAGAREMKRKSDIGPADLNTFVSRAVAQNGVAAGVTVHRPPWSGPFSSNNGYVEVIVAQTTPTFFMRLFNRPTMTVSTRTVAGPSSGGTGCLYVLSNTNDAKGFETSSGTGTIDMPGCDIYVNRTSDNAFFVSSGWTINARSIEVVGGSSTSTATINATLDTHVSPPAADPFIDVPEPSFALNTPCDYNAKEVKNTTEVLLPGVYCGGILVSQGGVAIFRSGIYRLKDGGLNLTQSSTVKNESDSDNGVTLYFGTEPSPNNNAAVTSGFTNVSHLLLKASKSGTYRGILFFYSRLAALKTHNLESDDQQLEGAVYMPTQRIQWKGSGHSYTILVVDNIKFGGSSSLSSNYASIGGTSPLPGGLPSVAE